MSTREKLLHTGGLLGRAHRTMRIMQSRDVQRKMCIYAAVGFVLLMFLVFAVRIVLPSPAPLVPETPETSAPTFAPTNTPTVAPMVSPTAAPT